MARLCMVWIVLVCLLFGFFKCAYCAKLQHRALRDYLLKDYGDKIRPVKTTETRTNVTFRPLFSSLIDMDTKHQEYKIAAWVKMVWKDEFLIWNTTDYDGIDKITLSSDLIWVPDITLYNSSTPVDILSDSRVEIHNDGMVYWYYRAMYTSDCAVYMKWFPFDTQICEMSFLSWVYTGEQLELFPDISNDGTQNQFRYKGVWDLVDISIRKVAHDLACCEYPFYSLDFRLVFSREPSFYINYMVLPVVLLSGLSITVFFLPPEMPSKLQFSITNLLALAVFQNLVAKTIPPVATNAPLIEIYFQLMVIMVGLSVLSTVTVVNISNRYREPIPSWLEILVLKVLSHIVCLQAMAEQVQQTATSTDTKPGQETKQATSLKDYTANGADPEQFHDSILIALANIRKDGRDEANENTDESQRQTNHSIALAEKWKVIALVVSRSFALVFAIIVFTCTTTILIYIKVMSNVEFDNALGENKDKWLREAS